MKNYEFFDTQHCTEFPLKDLAADVVYLYLFQGLSVKAIESHLFGSEEFRGFLSKSILNFYGISTATGCTNKGLYKEESLDTVAQNLLSSKNKSQQIVGSLLWHKLKSQIQRSS